MIKSLLIKLRRKPKIVREHVALTGAGIFTLLIFSMWVFTIPDRLSGTENTQSAGIFSTLKDEITKEAPDLGGIAEEFKEVVASSSEESDSQTEELIFEDSTIEIDLQPDNLDAETRPIRIATTSTETGSPEG